MLRLPPPAFPASVGYRRTMGVQISPGKGSGSASRPTKSPSAVSVGNRSASALSRFGGSSPATPGSYGARVKRTVQAPGRHDHVVPHIVPGSRRVQTPGYDIVILLSSFLLLLGLSFCARCYWHGLQSFCHSEE